MKKLLVATALLAATVTGMQAQEKTFIPAREGAVLEYKYSDRRGKALKDEWKNERWMRMTVEGVWRGDGEVVVNVGVENETFERMRGHSALGEAIAELAYGDVRVAGDGVTMENMQWIFAWVPAMFNFFRSQENGESEDEKITYGLELSATSRLPRELHVGDSLPDESYKALYREQLSAELQAERDRMYENFKQEISMSGMDIGRKNFNMPSKMDIEMTATMRNRRVEAFEKVRVPAGEFECWKISYEVVGPESGVVGMPKNIVMSNYGEAIVDNNSSRLPGVKHIDWISPEVGLVKREKYSANGKRVEEMTELTTVK